MNLGVVFNINDNSPELVIVHDYESGKIGYSTYNNEVAVVLDVILEQNIYSEVLIGEKIKIDECTKFNPYYLNTLNNYLPNPFRVLWVKKINDSMENALKDAYEILK